MNEKIKELMLQAGFNEKITETLDGWLCHEPVFNAEKFSELIVREILDVFDKRDEPGNGGWDRHEPAELIKEHFGVNK